MKYETEKDIFDVVRGFETGTISRDKWKHTEHLTVALYYLLHSENISEATDTMRAGIFNLLKAFEVDLTKEMPYHETLTVFWMRSVADFAHSKNGASIVEICSELVEKYDKDFPFRFYSREFLFSDEARKTFIEPDLDTDNEKLAVDYKSATHQNQIF